MRLADVAERAGMTVGHVELLLPVEDRAAHARHHAPTRTSTGPSVELALAKVRDPWKRLDKLLDVAASTGARDPGWVLWFQLWLESALDADVARDHHELDARWRTILADVIRYGVEQGAFVSADPRQDAMLLSSIVDGLSIQVTLGSPERQSRPDDEAAQGERGASRRLTLAVRRRALRPRSSALPSALSPFP